jgi:transcriptional regulator with XRE-family HTH domain
MKKARFDNDWLRALIAQSGKKNKDIAAALGVSPVTMGNYRSGKTTPSIDTLVRLLDALDMTTSEIEAAIGELYTVVEVDNAD